MKDYSVIKRKLLKEKAVRDEYEKLGPQFRTIQAIIEKRLKQGLSQKELAERMGTRQSAISRFESGTYNPTITFLQKVTKALNARMEIVIK